jgi:hypothetical protein
LKNGTTFVYVLHDMKQTRKIHRWFIFGDMDSPNPRQADFNPIASFYLPKILEVCRYKGAIVHMYACVIV